MRLNTLEQLVGMSLHGFKILLMTEVFLVDDKGKKVHSLGFFTDPVVATAFAESQRDPHLHKTELAHVLTNESVGYVISNMETIKLMDDEAEAEKIKTSVFAQMTDSQKKLIVRQS